MPLRYARILAEIREMPLAIHPAKLAAIREFLLLQSQGVKFSAGEILQRTGGAAGKRDSTVARSPGNVAVLSLFGIIAQRMNMMDDVSGPGGTSTERFTAQFRQAATDPNVKAIILNIDSPGGSVYGVPELAGVIRAEAAKGEKPVIAQVNSLAASAAYWLASAANEIVVTPSGEVGSIGVYTVHEDVSKMLMAMGVTPTIVRAGKYKIEDNPWQPLSDDARTYLQTLVDQYYEMFVKDVATGRSAATGSKVTPAMVRAGYGQGRVLSAKDAVIEGMADRVASLDETLARFGAGGAAAAPRTDSAVKPQPIAIQKRLDGVVYAIEPWPALAIISPDFAADEHVTVEGDEIMISVANGVALYRKASETHAGDWTCELQEGTHSAPPSAKPGGRPVAHLRRELSLIELS